MAIGCVVPGKSVGNETADGGADGSEGSEGDGGSETDDGGGDGVSSVGNSESEGGSEDEGSEGEDGSCPPVVDEPMVPACASCALTPDCDWTCDFSSCGCDGLACGDSCFTCSDASCLSFSEGACNLGGECVEGPAPDNCGPQLGPGFELELTEQLGCADMFVAAQNPEHTIGLRISFADWGVGEVMGATAWPGVAFDVPEIFEVRVGSDVLEDACNDAISNPPIIGNVWTAIAGTMDISVDPDSGEVTTATVTLHDVTFQEPGGATVDVATYTIEGVAVGWFPG